MNALLLPIVQSLEEISITILSLTTDDRTLNEWFGWNCPALNRHDLAYVAKKLANDITITDANNIPDNIMTTVVIIPARLQQIKITTLPQLFGSNATAAAPTYLNTIEWVRNTLSPLFEWENIKGSTLVPKQIANRLRGINDSLDALVPNMEHLEEQISAIQEATDAANSLPTDMQSLREGKKEIEAIAAHINTAKVKIDDVSKSALGQIAEIGNFKNEADKLVKQCEDAYKITTTHGLAAAFDQRAISLSKSMSMWVVGLICALLFGLYIGSNSIEQLSNAMSSDKSTPGTITINAILSLFSFGGPIWFAWIATKQIGQRFRLSEDYAFKASVAKAYEGYRKEAARIDVVLEARLFRSALTRLEEAPLRLVEDTTHGSPWHELINSDAFTKALDVIPELKKTFLDVAKGTSDLIKPVTSKIEKEIAIDEVEK